MKTYPTEQDIIEAEVNLIAKSCELHAATRAVIANQESLAASEAASAAHRRTPKADALEWVLAKLALSSACCDARHRLDNAEQAELEAETEWEEAVVELSNLKAELES
jgi:hypothetical protein